MHAYMHTHSLTLTHIHTHTTACPVQWTFEYITLVEHMTTSTPNKLTRHVSSATLLSLLSLLCCCSDSSLRRFCRSLPILSFFYPCRFTVHWIPERKLINLLVLIHDWIVLRMRCKKLINEDWALKIISFRFPTFLKLLLFYYDNESYS